MFPTWTTFKIKTIILLNISDFLRLPDLIVGGEGFGVITVGAAGNLASTEFKLVFSSNGDFFGRLDVALELVCRCWLFGC